VLLSLLICTVPGREAKLIRLLDRIEQHKHLLHLHIEDGSQRRTIGECRQRAIEQQKSEYLFFVDDDDLLIPGAIPMILEALDERHDCVAIKEWRYENGLFRGISYHSMECELPGKARITDTEWVFHRYINHICPIRTEIVKQIGFDPCKNRGEDQDFSARLRESGLLKTQAEIAEPIYEYWYRTEALRDPENPYDMRALGMAD
jgi:hypothetical protein